MLTKEQLIEKLKESQPILTHGCVSIAQNRFLVDNKVKYELLIFKCDKQELLLNVTLSNSSRWLHEGKSVLDTDSVFIGFLSETEEYEGGFENCKFNLSELLGEQE